MSQLQYTRTRSGSLSSTLSSSAGYSSGRSSVAAKPSNSYRHSTLAKSGSIGTLLSKDAGGVIHSTAYDHLKMTAALSPTLMDAAQMALSAYEQVCQEASQLETPDYPQNPFSAFSQKELENRFNAVVDAKNAVSLRQSATLADIGDCLLLLDYQLRLYERDNAFLESATEEIQNIKKQSVISGPINFLGLELLRSIISQLTYGESFYERHSALCSSVHRVLRTKDNAMQAALFFMSDPWALIEHRLHFLSAASR